jgi:hypothetical protein
MGKESLWVKWNVQHYTLVQNKATTPYSEGFIYCWRIYGCIKYLSTGIDDEDTKVN